MKANTILIIGAIIAVVLAITINYTQRAWTGAGYLDGPIIPKAIKGTSIDPRYIYGSIDMPAPTYI